MIDYAKKAVKLLSEKHLKLTTAESCTGGLIAKMITDVSGASAVFDCGIVSYSNNIKSSVLGVSEDTLNKFGAVSEQTVTEMVLGAIKISKADVAVAVSGIAGPLSDSTNKPVGLIWIAVYYNGKTITKQINNNFSQDIRNNNRNSAAYEALKLVCHILDS